MKAIHILSGFALVAVLFVGALSGCKKDPVFMLDSMSTGTIDLDGLVPPTTVPVNPVILVTLNYDVDPATATAENISLVQDYDHAILAIVITATGKTITIKPAGDLGRGTLYKLTLKTGIKSAGGLSLTEISRSFTTLGNFVPKGIVAYWDFENNANDQVGTYNPAIGGVVDITYTDSRNATAGKAATFNGTTSIVEVSNGDILMNASNFTLSFWVKANSAGHVDANQDPAGYFVMGLAAFFGMEFEISADFGSCKFSASYDIGGGEAVSEDLMFPGDGKDMNHGGWQGWEFCKDLTGSGGVSGLFKDKWANVVIMFDDSTKRGTLFINGERMKVVNFNLWPDGDKRRRIMGFKFSGKPPETKNELAFGFIQSRAGTFYATDPRFGYDFPTSDHFKGWLDDIRIFHKTLTEFEVQLMYNSEK